MNSLVTSPLYEGGEKYGSVYTPKMLADFVAKLCWRVSKKLDSGCLVLDPSSGELALLRAAYENRVEDVVARYVGVDVDPEAISSSEQDSLIPPDSLTLINDDFIQPRQSDSDSNQFWKQRIGTVDLVISNPPWSSDRRYSLEELQSDGFTLAHGQYDAYLLFIEQSMRLLVDGGIAAFILPDSLFSNSNIKLREFLATSFKVHVVARLGEKIFPEVNRSTAVIVLENSSPDPEFLCTCFRLDTDSRKSVLKGASGLYEEFLKNSHKVKQVRFTKSSNFSFDVDTKEYEESLIKKLQECSLDMSSYFQFSRGVEIAKSGVVAVCEHCGNRQGMSPAQRKNGAKFCNFCGELTSTRQVEQLLHKKQKPNTEPIYVGEDIQRYGINSCRFIKLAVPGISYKPLSIYRSPKILIRKTGLGIKASVDEQSALVTQTVYILTPQSKHVENRDIWYYLALINSRVVFYYYLKTFGENEWKSHPYLTKQTLFQLPLKQIEKVDVNLVDKVSNLARKLQQEYSRDIDLQLEELILKVYNISEIERKTIQEELLKLPNLSTINEMKF